MEKLKIYSYKVNDSGKKNDQNKIELSLNLCGISKIVSNFKNRFKNKNENAIIPITSLFRYATLFDKIMMIVGTLSALVNGATLSLSLVVFGNIVDSFTEHSKSCNTSNFTNLTHISSSKPLTQIINQQVIWFILLAIAAMIFSFFQVMCWLIPSETQVKHIRRMLFRSILRQEMGWFDITKSGELTTHLNDTINKYKDGIGDKVGSSIQYFSTFLVGIIIAFVKEWKMTLVVLSLSPLLFLSTIAFSKVLNYFTENELKAYENAGIIAEEVLTSIKTVFSFNGSQKEHKRYTDNLDEAKIFGIKKGILTGAVIGLLWIFIDATFALGFWYGWKLTTEIDPVTGLRTFSVGKILIVFFNIIYGIYALGQAVPLLVTLSESRIAAYKVFKIIDRKSEINVENTQGEIPKSIIGNIKFENIEFSYPSRKEVTVMKSFNLDIVHGTTIALVGPSGCGKSTCVQLLQRFYDPTNGSIYLDDKNIKNLNLSWLRKSMGVVSQEPVLFSTTIAENIRMGKDDVTQEDIENAAKNANAHEFIMSLPDKYETCVGAMGSQLSGGQKQRIAIARALVRNPKILLLDEATSALDNESELMVQAALDKARIGRTTIIVAHRLSTIRNADIICAIENGQVVESGTHDYLLNLKGLYYRLVTSQQELIDADNKVLFEKQKSFALNKTKSMDKSEHEKDDDEVTETKELKSPSFFKLLSLNKQEWLFILLGCIGSAICGGLQPSFSIVFAEIITIFQECDIDEQRPKITLYTVLFVIFGFVTLFGNTLQYGMFGIAGEKLTKRLRSQAFKTILSQDVEWFEMPENTVGHLTTRLAVEASQIQGATGRNYGYMVLCFCNLGVGFIISLIFSWPLTLLILSFIPFILILGWLQTTMISGLSLKDKTVYEEANKVTSEAINSIRTVVMLNKEQSFYKTYETKIEAPYKSSVKTAIISATGYGITNGVIFFAEAALFGVGAHLIENKLFGTNFESLLIVFSCLVFGAQTIGNSAANVPNIGKAKASAAKMFELLDRKPNINNWSSDSGLKINDSEFDSTIELNSIKFNYPTRPQMKVLNSLSITIKKGQQVALVGPSGCGKSTVVQLLERFYDPENGNVRISGKDIKELDLHWVRSQIGLVSQEPILFDTSVAENIAYGDNSREVSKEEIIEAARQANIHDFIMKLPNEYETNVGARGTQLSGGQKQRIAIARAIIRNPKILLLDEATSALDTESEKIVEEALEKARNGRTCIIIAQRLTTIQNADVIYVIDNGTVAEYGTHESLLNNNGIYSRLLRNK